MQRFATAVLWGLLVMHPAQTFAQATWVCGLSRDATQLVCVADTGPHDVAAAVARPTAVINGTSFPLDTRRQYVVDLLTQATDMEFVEQLARATLCYRTPSCNVAFGAPRSEVAPAARRP
jgi:hypothetical protein